MAILGIDEVGRGPWAGPLVIGACILPEPHPAWAEALTDSKKLTPLRREELSQIITATAPFATGWVTAAEIDAIGLSAALKLATRRAVQNLKQAFPKAKFSEIIIDGTSNFLADTPLANRATVLKKADFLIKEVSAASIVAKVARDHYMMELGAKYPGYGFEKHMGYGTAAHRAALAQLGPCPEHRKSVKPVARVAGCSFSGRVQNPCRHRDFGAQTRAAALRIPFKRTACDSATPSDRGGYAETVVADYLAQHGHKIIARNHKTKFYEIDIISTKGRQIFFTEVKYRKTATRGTPLEAITAKKQQQMRFAAEAFLKYAHQHQALQPLAELNPVLAAAAVFGPDFQLEQWFTLED